MDVAVRVEAALDHAGTAVALLSPVGGAEWVLRHVNGPFARLLGMTHGAISRPAEDLAALFANPGDWTLLLRALHMGTACQMDVRLHSAGAERWLGLRVAFGPETDVRDAVLIGWDVTAARRDAARDESSRRLLASIFARMSAPVAIVAADGTVTMSNTAFQQLLAINPAEAQLIRVDDLTPPEYAAAARAARAKQLVDGERYEMGLEALAKNGSRIPVWLTSVLLRDRDQRLRVVTLIPLSPDGTPAALPARDVGEVRVISLAAFRLLFGEGWERIATRAMLKAEHIIKRRLGAGDLVSRNDDHKFVIWFESTDTDHNESVLNGAAREIRLRLMTDFGEEAASYVSATVVPGLAEAAGSGGKPGPALPTRSQFEDMLRARQRAH